MVIPSRLTPDQIEPFLRIHRYFPIDKMDGLYLAAHGFANIPTFIHIMDEPTYVRLTRHGLTDKERQKLIANERTLACAHRDTAKHMVLTSTAMIGSAPQLHLVDIDPTQPRH